MDKYKILIQKVFEKNDSFEERLNSTAAEGWKAVSISRDSNRTVVLLQRG